MSETPRTDAIWDRYDNDPDYTHKQLRQDMGQLETELTAVRLELEKAKQVRNDRERRRSKAEAKNRRLTGQLTAVRGELDALKASRCDTCPVHPSVSGVESLKSQLAALQKAVRLTLDENAHLADGENCTLIRLKNALTPTSPQEVGESAPSCGTCVRICGIRDLGEPCKNWKPKGAV